MQTFTCDYLRALTDHNEQVENDLIACFTKPVIRKLRSRLRSPQAVEDAYQETLLRVLTYFRKGKTLRTPASLPGFVDSICRNVVFEMARAHRREWQSLDMAREPKDNGPSPESEVLIRERETHVRSLLSKASAKDRQLLEQLFLREEDRDQICRNFKVTRSYLRLLSHRARLRFKILWETGPSNELE